MQKKKGIKINKIFNFRLMLFIAICLCMGICTTYSFMLDKILAGVLLSVFFTLGILLFGLFPSSTKRIKVKTVFILIFLLFYVLGGLLFYFSLSDYRKADLGNHFYSVNGRVDEVVDTDNGSRLLVSSVKISGARNGKLRYKIYAYVYENNKFDVGDQISFYSKLLDKKITYEGNFSATDIVRKIKYTTELTAEEIVVTGNSLTVFEKMNLFIRETLKKGLDREEFAISYAMLTGYDEFIDTELLTSYRSAGIAHVFAVSGLHIGFLAMALGFLFDKIRMKRLPKALLITSVLFFYSGVCGFSSSSIRAAVMTAVSLFLSIGGKRYDGLTSVSLSAVLILMFSPIQLFYVGFQLSFIVVIGMIVLSPSISKAFKFLPRKLASSIGAVLSAQLVGAPICLYAFGKFSLIAIIANLIFIPCVSAIFIALLVCVLLGGLFNIAKVTLFIPGYVLKFVNMCISAFDYDIFIIGGVILGGFGIVYYLVLITVGEITNLKKKIKLILTLVLTTCFLCGSTIVSVKDNKSIDLFVLGAQNICASALITPKENVFVLSEVKHVYSSSRLKRLKEKQKVDHFDTIIILNGFNADEQVFLTKFLTVFSVGKLIYFGEKNVMKEEIIKRSFSDIELCAYGDNSKINTENYAFEYALNGHALTTEIDGEKVAIFSRFDENNGFMGLNGEYDIVVSVNLTESVCAYYNAKTSVSYRARAGEFDGEENGTFRYSFN